MRGVFETVEMLGDIVTEGAPGLGDLDRADTPFEKLNTQKILQDGNLLAHGDLAHAHLAGRVGKALVPRRTAKVRIGLRGRC